MALGGQSQTCFFLLFSRRSREKRRKKDIFGGLHPPNPRFAKRQAAKVDAYGRKHLPLATILYRDIERFDFTEPFDVPIQAPLSLYATNTLISTTACKRGLASEVFVALQSPFVYRENQATTPRRNLTILHCCNILLRKF
jgi:hypothetical protein